MRRPFFLSATLVLLLGLGLVWAAPAWQSVEVEGRERRYLVHPPPSHFRGPRPVLLVFHGGGSNARQAARMGFAPAARELGYIAVYPEGVDGRWYDRRSSFPARDGTVPNDVRFVGKLLEQVEREYRVDPHRIYATGMSNGGMMSHLVGEQLGPKFAAIAPVIGGIPKASSSSFSPRAPLSVLMIQGTADPVVPYQGGEVMFRGKKWGTLLPAELALKLWVEFNACQKPRTARLPNLVDDGCRVEKTSYRNPKNGSEVLFYKVSGGGHTMPGGSQYLPERLIGKLCRDIDGVSVIMSFFERHRRR